MMLDTNIKKLLTRFKRDDIEYVAQQWGKFTVDDFGPRWKKWTKTTLASAILEQIKDTADIETEDVAQLDLIYMNRNPSTKSWTLYNYSQVPGKKKGKIKDPDKLAKSLQKEISLYFRAEVSVRIQDNVTWVRFWLHDGKQSSTNIVYLAYVPSTSYFFMTAVKKQQLSDLVQCIMLALDGHSPVEGYLKGKNLYALFELLSNKYSEVNKGKGSFGALRRDRDLGPLSRKRKPSEALSVESPQGVECENQEEKCKNHDSMLNVFGPSEQPALEKVEYSLKTPFKAKYVPMDTLDTSEAFDCKVTFTGTNVIEGIKKLGQLGVIEHPIPAHLREIHLKGQNRFSIKPKSKRTGATPPKV